MDASPGPWTWPRGLRRPAEENVWAEVREAVTLMMEYRFVFLLVREPLTLLPLNGNNLEQEYQG